MKTLYDITGDIRDINTLLVQRKEYEAQSQDAKLEPLVREALRKAFSFGQRYWQQADSEYASDHKKSDKTQLKFLALIEETIAAMQGEQQ